MKDISLLSELEVKVRQLVSTLEKEREKNSESEVSIKASKKLSQVETKVNNLINLISQLENF
jgi:hypothetical protein